MTKCSVESSNGCRQEISGSALQVGEPSETYTELYVS